MVVPTFYQLDKPPQFRLSIIKEIEDFFIAEINNKKLIRKIMSKTHYNKHIATLDYADKTLFILSGA